MYMHWTKNPKMQTCLFIAVNSRYYKFVVPRGSYDSYESSIAKL